MPLMYTYILEHKSIQFEKNHFLAHLGCGPFFTFFTFTKLFTLLTFFSDIMMHKPSGDHVLTGAECSQQKSNKKSNNPDIAYEDLCGS